MEIKLTKLHFFLFRKRALLIIMRTFIFLFCTTVFSFSTEISFSQEKVMIHEDVSLSVDEVFSIIKNQTNYRFIYPRRMFKNTPNVGLKKGEILLTSLLEQTLANKDVDFRLSKNKTIILINKPPAVNLDKRIQQAITGKVTDKDGIPLVGATVRIEGKRTGTLTDFDGMYSINASTGQTLVFSYLGKKETKITIENKTTIDIILEDSTESLDEVVVTALGIRKEKKAIGYAITTVKKELIEDRTEGDIGRILSGKVTGLNITSTSGFSGSGTNVIIRGLSSFTGSNQALFVVDGVPYNNDSNQDLFGRGFLNSNQDTNRGFDLDPNNIESVEVLKGISAATLYGSRGANGVILITTKSGGSNSSKRSSLTVSQSTFINNISTTPDYQNEYGQGDDNIFDPTSFNSWGPRFSKDGLLGYGSDPNIDDNGTVAHPQSRDPNFPEFDGARIPYKPATKNFKNIFKPGYTYTTSINFNGVSEDSNTFYNASFGHLNDESFVPGNGVTRTNISVGGSTKILEKLKVSASANFTITDQSSPNVAFDITGLGRPNIIANTLAIPRSVDLFASPFANRENRSLFFSNITENPRWDIANKSNQQLTNRNSWRMALDYEINNNLSVVWRTARDVYTTEQEERTNRNGPRGGSLRKGTIQGSILDHLLTLNGKYNLNKDLNLSFTLGANGRRDEQKSATVTTGDQQLLDNFLFNNFDPGNNETSNDFFRTFQNQIGVFGQATLDFKDYIFLNAAVRSDWVSNLKRDFNNAIYPSVSLSIIPTTIFEELKSEKGLNYFKIRGSYGESVRFAGGFPSDVNIAIGSNTALNISTHNVSTAVDASILPEKINEYEVGIEARFFKKRGSLDLSLWKRRTIDIQSRTSNIPASVGQGSFFTNTGVAEAEGIEIDLGFKIIKSQNFNWNSRINFSSHNEILVRRDDIFERFGRDFFGFGIFGNIGRNVAVPGESLGAIAGTRVMRSENGTPIIATDGNYIREASDEEGNAFILGDAIADYRMNFINEFKYKSWSLNFMVQHVKGGDIYSPVPSFLLGRGLIKDNLEAHGNSIIIKGVTETGEPNTVAISPERYYRFNRGFNNTEFSIYDASVIRLQELAISYSIPDKLLDKMPFSSLRITARGNNLWHSAYNIPKGTNFDPNTSGGGVGNNRGLDFSSNAGSRRFGITLRASF